MAGQLEQKAGSHDRGPLQPDVDFRFRRQPGRSGWFKAGEIIDSRSSRAHAGAGELIKFTVKAQVVSPSG
jgi:hypothetical protein